MWAVLVAVNSSAPLLTVHRLRTREAGLEDESVWFGRGAGLLADSGPALQNTSI